MALNEEEFNEQFTEPRYGNRTMAETPEIDPEKFFSMVCVLENLQFSARYFMVLSRKLKE